MSRVFPNAVASVTLPPVLVLLIESEQRSWCQQVGATKDLLASIGLIVRAQFSEEGYTVIQVDYPRPDADQLRAGLREARMKLDDQRDWALLTYGFQQDDVPRVSDLSSAPNLKACIHFCPLVENGAPIVLLSASGERVP